MEWYNRCSISSTHNLNTTKKLKLIYINIYSFLFTAITDIDKHYNLSKDAAYP